MKGRAFGGNAARVWLCNDVFFVPAPGGSQSLPLLSYPGAACRDCVSQGPGRLANDCLDCICLDSRLLGICLLNPGYAGFHQLGYIW